MAADPTTKGPIKQGGCYLNMKVRWRVVRAKATEETREGWKEGEEVR